MNKTTKISVIAFLSLAISFSACKKDDDELTPDNNNNNNNNNPPITNVNKYMGSASYGDVITYEVDEGNKTYKYHNETTNQTDSGTFVVSTDAATEGVYKISIGSDNFYAVELEDKIFATSLPSGRVDNLLSVSISSELDLSTNYTIADLAGKYLCLNFDNKSIRDSTVWGGFDLKPDGTYTFNYGPNYAQDFDENLHFSGLSTGTFTIDSENPSRMIIHSNANGQDYIGTIYPDKLLLLDNGVGNGFSIGIKYPDSPITQSSIAGNYRYLDITVDGYQGVGAYSIPASGGVLEYTYEYNTATIPAGTGSTSDFAPVSQVNNCFETTDENGITTTMILLPGEVMMHFSWNNNGLLSYGVGAKID